MSKKDTMAKLPGLFERDGVYYLRVMIPKDLREAYGAREKFVESLNTRDNRQARFLGTQMRASRLAEFEQRRRELAPPKVLDRITAELSNAIAERLYAATLAGDDRLRGDPETVQAIFRDITIAVGPSALRLGSGAPSLPEHLSRRLDPLQGLTAELAESLSDLNAQADGEAMIALARKNLASVLPQAQAEARRLGLYFDANTPGAKETLLASLKAIRRGRSDVMARDRGEIVETPQEVPTEATRPRTMRDVFEKWEAASEGGTDAKRACARALALYEEWAGTGAPPVQQVTRAQGHEFKSWLMEKSKAGKYAGKTVHGYLMNICSLLRFAHHELEWTTKHPWLGLSIAYRTEKTRDRWPRKALETLAALPLFQSFDVPRTRKGGAEAAYWLPLLGLYYGATVSELAQLKVADVQDEGVEGLLLRITDEGAGQGLKTEQRRRVVPVHSELIRLGFGEYVEAVKKHGSESLWPNLLVHAKKPGTYFSGWWGEFRKRTGPDGEVVELLPDFHSMRHTARSTMADAEHDAALLDVITGHGKRGSEGVRTYTHFSPAAKRKAVESIRYEALAALPKVYSGGLLVLPKR